MTTSYGKELRRIRITRDLLLKDMANCLEITSAYLSSIENGKRKIPVGLTKKIESIYSLSEDERNSLQKAEDETRESIEFNFADIGDSNRKEVVLALARRFDDITDDELKKIKEILG